MITLKNGEGRVQSTGVPILTKRPRKQAGNLKVTSVRLPEDLIQKLDDLADRANSSRNEVLIEILRWGIPAAEKELESEET